MNGTAPAKSSMGQPVPRHPHIAPVNTQYLASSETYTEPSRRRKSIASANGLLSGISHDSGLGSFGSSFPLNLSTSGLSPSGTPEPSWTFRNIAPPPSTIKFILLCILWYGSSALSSNTGKVILNNFRYPVTLTIVQFFFVAGYCWLLTDGARMLGIAQSWKWLASRVMASTSGGSSGGRKSSRSSAHSRSISLGLDTSGFSGSRLKRPTRAILAHTCPMAAFQVMGHIFASMAMSRIPVSTVHTIKVSLMCGTRSLTLIEFGNRPLLRCARS
jgi:solute carrier family 35 protein E1